ncbi:DUF551 domain-containing protein [Klebsiella quasipneumoniae]|uniref:DUF551 domain-containing protein n=1 Tax=Klebsiella quasipneumoniae TaxID=1463165 RepID=UPI00344DB917
MTKSTITRERLEKIKSWRETYGSGSNVMLPAEEAEALALIALAAMDSEPHTDDELSNLLWYSQEATCHSDPNYYCEFQRLATPGLIAGIIRELQERRKADSEPVGTAEPISFDEWSRKCALQITLCYPDFREKAQYIWDSARETMHVAPVAMPECFSNAVSALESLYRNGQKQGWNERYTTDMAYASGVLNACRAAMLAAAPQSPSSEPATVPGTWIPVSERMPPSRHEVLVGRWWGEKPRWCCKWATYIPGHPDAQSSGWLIPGASWTPTHWMPLPAGPQEVKGE